MPPKCRRTIAVAFVERVIVGDGRLEFTFRFGGVASGDGEVLVTEPTAPPARVAEAVPTSPDTVRIPVDPYFIRLPRDGERCPWTGLTRAWLNKLIASPEGSDNPPRVLSIELVDPGKARGVRLIDFASLMNHIRAQEAKNSNPESDPTDHEP